MCVSSCLFVHEQDSAKSFQAIFMKSCRIMDYCQEKNSIHFGNRRMKAILNYRYILHTTYFQRHSLGTASVVGLGGGMRSIECLFI